MMYKSINSNLRAVLARLSFVSLVVVACAAGAQADDGEAKSILRAMSDYLAAQQTLSFNYDSDLEIVTTDLQKVTFASSGTVSLTRPDKIRVSRTGGFADVEMVFDGKMLTILGKNIGRYAQVDAPGTIDQLVDNLRVNVGIEAPGADLLLSDVFDQLTDAVVDAKDLGSGIIGGVECDHLAFRTTSVDWEIWIATGDRPYPCRYVVTSKLMAQAPQYRVQISQWKTGTDVASDDFAFRNQDGATEADLSEIQSVDEVPYVSAEGAAQ